MISFRCSPLLDLALSLLVLQNPERFGSSAPWIQRVLDRLGEERLDALRSVSERTDLFALALDVENGPPLPTPDALRRLQERRPIVGGLLGQYWDAISPEVGARAGLLAESISRETRRLGETDPLTYIAHFSDRVTVTEDGEAILLHWGQGMRVPLRELERILFIPSAFCPRRLMFYRLGPVQIFFYDPLQEEQPSEAETPPESLQLAFSALADLTRLMLMRLIAREEMPAQEMARRLDLNESTVSRHLRLLAEAGLVGRSRQEGKFIFYALQEGRIEQLMDQTRWFLGRSRP